MAKLAPYLLLAIGLSGLPSRSQELTEARLFEPRFLFDVRPHVIAAGQPALLHWSIKGATKVVIEEVGASEHGLRKIGTFEGSGNLQVKPKEDTTYVVSSEGSTLYSCASVSLGVRVKQR